MFLSFLLVPLLAAAGSIEGSVQGFFCVTQGKVCPIGKEDPMIAAERVFVVLTDKGDYYFIPNLDRAVLGRHIGKTVRVTGKINTSYKSIRAEIFEVKENGKWRTTWSREMQEKMLKWLEIGRGG
jgi:hypothetical protein